MAQLNVYPVILSGGVGSRLWPASRQDHPKQLHALTGAQTMLQETVSRVNPQFSNDIVDFRSPLVVCNKAHVADIEAQITSMGGQAHAIIAEPMGRNTAPAAALAALVMAESDPSGILLILPADHHITHPEAFRAAIGHAAQLASLGHLVTYGIVPDKPETGYGYIAVGEAINGAGHGFNVEQFVEKPDRRAAESYLAHGGYYWNGGIFTVRADTLIEEMERYCPAILNACRDALNEGERSNISFTPSEEKFGECPSDSIDYAVMEHTEKAAIIPVDMGWNDVGSWSAIYDVGAKGEGGNVTSGDVLLVDTKNALVRAESRFVAVAGLENVIVVETEDAVLVTTREHAQSVKTIVARLKSEKPELL